MTKLRVIDFIRQTLPNERVENDVVEVHIERRGELQDNCLGFASYSWGCADKSINQPLVLAQTFLDITDEFVESLIAGGCLFAKHRNSDVLETKGKKAFSPEQKRNGCILSDTGMLLQPPSDHLSSLLSSLF